MGPMRNKRTYSKAVSTVPKTVEERRKRYKSRKIVPAFDQLFLTGDENKPKTPNCAKKGKNGKSVTIFEDSLAEFQLPPPSTRKPLATKNDNTSSVGTSSHSSCSSLNENDTFDKLWVNKGKATGKRQSKAPIVAAKSDTSKSASNSSTSYINTSESNALLYCSLLPKGASGELSAQNFSSLLQKNRKTVKQKKQDVRNPPAQENASSLDLFDSTNHQSEDSLTATSTCSSGPASPLPQRRTTRTLQSKRSSKVDTDVDSRARTTATKRCTKSITCQDAGPRVPVIPTNEMPRERRRTKVALKDLEADWTEESNGHKFLVADWTDESDENAAQTREESKKKLSRRRTVRGKVSVKIVEDKENQVVNVEKNEKVRKSNLKMQNRSPALHSSKRLTVQTPEENVGLSVHHSRGSHNSNSDYITSTPANQTTARRIPSDGTPWGIQLAPMLEDEALSPVNRDSCFQGAFERSSIFESPMTFRSKCRGSTASESGLSPPYTTANEDPGTKTRNINETEQRNSLRNDEIPVFDPEDRVSSQFKLSKSPVEYSKSQSRELRRSKESERKSQKHVTIKEDKIESRYDQSVFNDKRESFQENVLSNSVKIMDQNDLSLSLMQISLSDIIQNYNTKKRRGTIAKKITDHETTSELIKIGVLGTRTSLRLESKIVRQNISNLSFNVPTSVKKSKRSRKEVQEIRKLNESLSLSTEFSNISIYGKKIVESFLVNQNSSLAPSLSARSPVVKKQIPLRRSKRSVEDKKKTNISTDQEISQIITRPSRKRSSRNKKNISTDMEQSYSFNDECTRNHISGTQISSNKPTRKSLRRKTNSVKDRSSSILSSKIEKIVVDEEKYNISSYSTRRSNESNNMQSTLDGSSVLSTFTRQRRKRKDKVVYTRPDTSVSDYSVMSMGDSVISMQSVNELPVIKENSNSYETSLSSDTLSEKSNSDNSSDEYSTKDVSSEESEDEFSANENAEENDHDEEHELSEYEMSNQIECSDFADETEEECEEVTEVEIEESEAINVDKRVASAAKNEMSNQIECSDFDDVSEEECEEVTEDEIEEITEDEIEENEAINVDKRVLSAAKDVVSLYVKNEPTILTPIQSVDFSGFPDKNSAHVNKTISVFENSNINSQSKVDMSIDDSIEVIEKLEELSIKEQEASMLEVDNSYNNSVSMIEVENISKLKLNPVSEVNETSNMQSASMLELEDACESLLFFNPGSKISAKPGKGYRRSLNANLLASFNESVSLENKVETDSRRQTVHRISNTMVKEPVVRISRLPVEFENKFHRRSSMVPLPSLSRLSQRKSSYCCVRKSSTDIPSDPKMNVLQLCSQREPLPISDCFTPSRLSCCKKIGEGVYGEVFMSRPNPNSMDGATVLKIMPIEGDAEINGERQKKFHEILSEIVISVELSNLRLSSKTRNWCATYVNVLKCWCLEGEYLSELITFWDDFNNDKGSENDRPDMFPTNQLYIVLEFGHGGTDLEGYVFNSAAQSLAVFRQIVMSLAVAEQELEFEHRDLHWGNVLVAQTKETSIKFKVAGQDYTLNTQGVCCTIIDFTLSRLNAPNCVVYNNLGEDPDLFVAEGDYQFEIYRQMKNTNNNNWESFNPYTNVLWLHYILEKMIKDCYYKKTTTKVHKTNMLTLNQIKDRMLQYKSATDYIQNQ